DTQSDDGPAGPELADAAGRPADRSLGHLGEHRAVGDDRPSRLDVLVDADPATPDRQEATDSMDEPLAPARRERRGRAPEEPRKRLGLGRMQHTRRDGPN